MAGCAGEPVGNWDLAALAYLREHWGSAFDIAFSGGIWQASYLGGNMFLTAATADELREKIRAGYIRRTRLKLVRAGTAP